MGLVWLVKLSSALAQLLDLLCLVRYCRRPGKIPSRRVSQSLIPLLGCAPTPLSRTSQSAVAPCLLFRGPAATPHPVHINLPPARLRLPVFSDFEQPMEQLRRHALLPFDRLINLLHVVGIFWTIAIIWWHPIEQCKCQESMLVVTKLFLCLLPSLVVVLHELRKLNLFGPVVLLHRLPLVP